MKRIIQQGTKVATGAAMSFNCGFRPRYVRVYNVTQLALCEAFGTMTAAHMALSVDTGAGAVDITAETSGGITITNTGFTLGTNADLNTASDVIHWVAF